MYACLCSIFMTHLTVEYLKFEEGKKKKINQPPSPKEITQKCNALQDCTEILQITENKVIKTREGHTLISMTS